MAGRRPLIIRPLLASLAILLPTLAALGAPPPTFGRAGDDDDRMPPAGSIVLFDGTTTVEWRRVDSAEPIRWPVVDGSLAVCPGCGDIRTVQTFGDFRLHLEFRVPATPDDLAEQDRGNSGIYLQARYEIQVLDSFGRALSGWNDAGAVYGVKDADTNAALPAETWQTYALTFRAARWSNGIKTENARLTLSWNDVLVHDDVEIPSSTAGGDAEGPEPGPLLLQDHGNPVRYANIWIEPLP
jgi:Domain of Unknown Function (DUF1080)